LKSLLLKTFNGRPEEFSSIGLMLILGFFTGIFLATYDVAAPALFLAEFEDNTVLAQAILFSGVLSVFSTYIYAFLQRKIAFKNLVLLFLLITLGATAVIWVQSNAVVVNKTVVFIAFILALPFSFTASLIFWGYFGRVFNLKQSKRVIGGIDTGQLIASIISLFAIGYILDNNIIVTPQLYIGSVIGLAGMIATSFITNPLIAKSKSAVRKVKAESFIKIFGNRYTRWMTLFVIISLIAITFIDYSFLTVTNIQWTTVAEKGAFLAKFEATVVIFSFLFQTFVTDWLIENYGLRTSLLVNPLLAILLASVALLVGLLIGYSTDAGSSFVWFFLAIAASKLFIDSLKDALDGPTFKLYFLPIDSDVKYDVTTKVEGVITAIGGVIAGLILIGMNQLNIELIYVVVGIIPMLFMWYVITNRMHLGYKSTLQLTLEKNKESYDGNEVKSENELPEDQLINDLKLLERTSPGEFETKALTMLDSVEGSVFNFLDKKIKEMELEFDSKPSSSQSNQELKNLASKAAIDAESSDVISISPDRLYTLSKSHAKEDRLLATKLLRSLISDKSIFVLLELLRDQNINVKKQAIITARKVKRKETWPLLIELLSNRTFTYDASSALIASGQEVLQSLENAFHRSGQSQSVMLKIISIISQIDLPESHDILWEKIDFPDRKIVRQILLAFKEKNFRASEDEVGHLNDILSDEIGKTIWNLAAIDELSNESYNDLLKKALKDEVESNFSMIYIILSMLYDAESIELVKENIEAGTTEGNTFALELLDIFIAPDLKPKLFPILDDIDTSEKLTKLQHFYPRQSYDEATTYNFLLNRDYNNINRWTKACTLYALKHNKQADVTKSIIAQMFNPDNLLSELAASILINEDRAAFDSITERLVMQNSNFKTIIERIESEQPIKFEICRYFADSEAFNFLVGLHVSQVIDKAELVELDSGEELNISDEQYAYYVLTSKPTVSTVDGNESDFEEHELIGNMFSDEKMKLQKITAKEDTKLFKLSLNDVFDVLTNYKNLSNKLINKASKNLQNHFYQYSKP
jgi:ATP/ADP translocase